MFGGVSRLFWRISGKIYRRFMRSLWKGLVTPLRKNRGKQFDFEEEHSAKKRKETTRYYTLALERKILKTPIT